MAYSSTMAGFISCFFQGSCEVNSRNTMLLYKAFNQEFDLVHMSLGNSTLTIDVHVCKYVAPRQAHFYLKEKPPFPVHTHQHTASWNRYSIYYSSLSPWFPAQRRAKAEFRSSPSHIRHSSDSCCRPGAEVEVQSDRQDRQPPCWHTNPHSLHNRRQRTWTYRLHYLGQTHTDARPLHAPHRRRRQMHTNFQVLRVQELGSTSVLWPVINIVSVYLAQSCL